MEFDQHWLNDLKIAKEMADAKRKEKSADYNYPTFPVGQTIFVRPDNSKNASTMEGIVHEDQGGATGEPRANLPRQDQEGEDGGERERIPQCLPSGPV